MSHIALCWAIIKRDLDKTVVLKYWYRNRGRETFERHFREVDFGGIFGKKTEQRGQKSIENAVL